MYQFKLEGLDDDWTPATAKTEATYSSLPPGTYKFLVKAMTVSYTHLTLPTSDLV